MSEQIDKRIERVKEEYEIRENSDTNEFIFDKLAGRSIMPIISDRERLKAELQKKQYPLWLIKEDGTKLKVPEAKAADYLELKAELSKAQEKITKLKAKLEIATGNTGLYDDNATDSA